MPDKQADIQQKKQQEYRLAQYQWKKGESGNPAGRPKGKTLKEFAREYLLSLDDDEKIDYLKSLPTEIVWKMAEGNPENKIDAQFTLSDLREKIKSGELE